MTYTIYDFGQQLVESKDLDPVYVVVWEAQLEPETLRKWLLAYFCFYHCGTASWIVDQKDYWTAMETAAASKDYLRSSERRHFRGSSATKSVTLLKEQGLEKLFSPLEGGPYTLQQIVKHVKTWYKFGDWIAFKVADLIERLGLCQVTFKPEDVFAMYESPRKGAEDMVVQHGPAVGNPYLWAYNTLHKEIGNLKAPPRYERGLNIQELETIFCKHHSHLKSKNGYQVGKDIAEVKHGLLKYSRCPTSQLLIKAGRKGGLWQ